MPYTIKQYQRQNLLAPKELRDVHPLGKSPVITDGPVTLAESGAIVGVCISTIMVASRVEVKGAEYLLGKYGTAKHQPNPEGTLHDLYCESTPF